jgi:hypothetical protein
VNTAAIPDRFTTLPDEPALQATVVALEEHGFSVEVVGDLDAAPGGAGPHPGGLVAQAAYGQHSQVGKILEIHQELPGRIHIVLIRQQVGY